MVIDENIASVGHQGLTVDCFGFSLSIVMEVKDSRNPVCFKYKREDTWYDMTDGNE